MRRIAIFGSREYTSKLGLHRLFLFFCKLQNSDEKGVIVTGGASGIDSKAERFGPCCGYSIELLTPEMEIAECPGLPYAAACVIRDKKLIDTTDESYAWWNESSAGTIHGIKRAYETNKPIQVIGNTGQDMTRAEVEARFVALGKPMKAKTRQAKSGLEYVSTVAMEI